MLNDDVLGRTLRFTGETERRDGDRRPFAAELVVTWDAHPEQTLRYPIENVSEGGYMLRSTLPVLEGELGMAIRTIPTDEGGDLQRKIMVVWSQPGKPFEGYHIGVQFVEAE